MDVLDDLDWLRTAGLVNDLIFDRRTGPDRGIDPRIVDRHLDDAVHMQAGAAATPEDMQAAVSTTIMRTHLRMVETGIGRQEDLPALMVGRMLFAAEVAASMRDREETRRDLHLVSG